ncbi:MAG: hypothetical protein KDK71_02555 [Chlamydiia bacterium]|nr:hypothetical protein [Chlamydiia bacterium]
MNRFLFLLVIPFFCHAHQETFSTDRLKRFGKEFSSNQTEALIQAGLIDGEPKTAPTLLSPKPKAGYLPVMITNTTGLSADEIYVTLAGQQVAGGTQYFFELAADSGVLSPVAASPTSYSPSYSYLLSTFPQSSTGNNDYIAYVSDLAGARFYFSIKAPIYLKAGPGNAIAPPTYFAFYDPNYNTLYETVELTYINDFSGKQPAPAIPWTASVNTTEVDAFCLPIKIQYYSYSADNPNALTPIVQIPNALPSGFGEGGASGATTRQGVLNSVTQGLSDGDLSGATPKVWPRLAVPFYSDPYNATGLQTYLRVLSPKQGNGNTPDIPTYGGISLQHRGNVDGSGTTQFKNYNYPFFPDDYFSGTTYGAPTSFADSLFSFYTGSTNLYISTGGGSATIYEGTTSGTSPNYLLTFSVYSGPGSGPLTLNQGDMTVYKMYSGSQILGGPAPNSENIGFYFGDAFTAGVLPSATGTAPGAPINITDATIGGWQDTNVPNYYSPLNSAVTGGPWYSLYAKELHKVAVRTTFTTPSGVPGYLSGQGLCYAYDFDDSLGISGTITPSNLTSSADNLYARITLGSIDTPIPDPYSDPNTYTVTFNIPGSNTLSYKQSASGPYIPVTSGTPIANISSNKTKPLYIHYTNGQGTSEFLVYLYYQFLVPLNTYADTEISVINSTSINPNSATPTSFTLEMNP